MTKRYCLCVGEKVDLGEISERVEVADWFRRWEIRMNFAF